MAINRKVFVLVPGAYHTPEMFSKVISILEPLGYKCVTVEMPAVGRANPVTSLDEDIAAVRTAVVKEVDAGQDVIINAHSWAGIPVNSALDGLGMAERSLEGKKGGVSKLTFVSAVVLPEKTSLLDSIGGVKPDYWNIQSDGNLLPDHIIPRLYHDLDPKDQDLWASKLKPHSYKASLPRGSFLYCSRKVCSWTSEAATLYCHDKSTRITKADYEILQTFITKTKSAAWMKIPSIYLVCENDRAIPVQVQDNMVAAVKNAGGEIETERLFVSHSAYLARPNYVAEFLRRAAGEQVAKAD